MMSRLDKFVGGCLTALGVVHISATPLSFPRLNESAGWFISGGLALIFCGALNLLRERYAIVAPGVRRVSMVANVAVFVLACTFVIASGRSAIRSPKAYFLLLTIVSATVFSFRRPPRLWSIRDEIKPHLRRAA